MRFSAAPLTVRSKQWPEPVRLSGTVARAGAPLGYTSRVCNTHCTSHTSGFASRWLSAVPYTAPHKVVIAGVPLTPWVEPLCLSHTGLTPPTLGLSHTGLIPQKLLFLSLSHTHSHCVAGTGASRSHPVVSVMDMAGVRAGGQPTIGGYDVTVSAEGGDADAKDDHNEYSQDFCSQAGESADASVSGSTSATGRRSLGLLAGPAGAGAADSIVEDDMPLQSQSIRSDTLSLSPPRRWSAHAVPPTSAAAAQVSASASASFSPSLRVGLAAAASSVSTAAGVSDSIMTDVVEDSLVTLHPLTSSMTGSPRVLQGRGGGGSNATGAAAAVQPHARTMARPSSSRGSEQSIQSVRGASLAWSESPAASQAEALASASVAAAWVGGFDIEDELSASPDTSSSSSAKLARGGGSAGGAPCSP